MTTKAMQKPSTRKLKIIPGRGLSGRDIQKRLRNRTLEGQTFGDDAYMLNEEMDAFMKMSKVEQIMHVKENNERIRKMQNDLDNETNARKKKEQEQQIEREIQRRIQEIGKQQSQQTQNPTNNA